ncbi:MAG TPA: hypothetical protein VF484_01935, partial [Candidatus Limnocylindrales bacterium]
MDGLLEVPVRQGPAHRRRRQAGDDRAGLRLAVHDRVPALRSPALRRRILPSLVVIGLLIAGWQLYAGSSAATARVLPSPTRVIAALWDQRDLALHHTLVTLGETAVGFGASLVLAALAGVVMELVPAVRRALYPLLVGSQSLPILVVAPILVL